MALIFNGTKYGKPYLDGIKRNTFMQTFNGKNKVWLNTDIITFNFYCADSFDVKPGAITRPNVTLQYKIDGSPWMPYMNDITLYVPGGKHIYFRGNAYNGLYTSDSEDNAWTINGSNVQIYGSILSLTGGASDALGEYAFSSMLRNCVSISQVSDSLLAGIQAIPAYGYASMFANCTSLVNAPALPATTLAARCYASMFQACTSLVNAPQLPATTMAEGCCYEMFYGCTSLVSPPALPATTLANQCYYGMFADCASMVSAPDLPADTLAEGCYKYMFNGCTSLYSITAMFTSWDDDYTNNWVSGVGNAGTFTKPATLPDERGDSRIPNGWSAIDF